MMDFSRCVITGDVLKQGQVIPFNGSFIEYKTDLVGRVKITMQAYADLLYGNFPKAIIGGICKHKTIDNEEPILIDPAFINGGYKSYNPPIEFEEKCFSFLKYLYLHGGRENHDFRFRSSEDSFLAYADMEEFGRIMDFLLEERLLSIENQTGTIDGNKIFFTVKVTSKGKKEAGKALPKMPLFGLVSQEISTGDSTIDEKINHARKLFFDEHSTLDNMRSACETLSFVLEPLRKDLELFFNAKDINDFFQIVNNFDIRHNKPYTKDIKHAEQLEWVFYSLLNTINVYYKLKQKQVLK